MSYNSKYKGSEVEKGIDLAYTALLEHQDISHLATKEEIPYVPTKVSELENDSDYATQGQVKELINAIPIPDVSGLIAAALVDYVKKVEGKGLSTNDFTNELKEKLEGITPYDPSELEAEIGKLETTLNTLVSGNASNAIESFNEIVAFLNSVSDTETLSGIIAGINTRIAEVEGKIPTKVSQLTNDKGYLTEHQDISNLATKEDLNSKQDVISDLDDIRAGASRKIPTKVSELDNDAGYLTEHQDISNLATKLELSSKQDVIVDLDEIRLGASRHIPTKVSELENDEGYLKEHQDISHLATKDELNGKQDKIEDLDAIRQGAFRPIPTKTSELTNDSGFLTEHQDISHLATKEELNSKQDLISDLNTIREGAAKGATALQSVPEEYITETELENKGYLTEHQDISYLATKDELSAIDIKAILAKNNADDALNQLIDLDSEVDKLANATYKNKGYYKTFDQLTTNVPTADIGCIAYVGINYPFDIYEWTEAGWIATGGTGGDFVLNLDNYYTKDEVTKMFVKSSSVRELNTNYSPETLEKMKEEGMLDENVFYFGFEEE